MDFTLRKSNTVVGPPNTSTHAFLQPLFNAISVSHCPLHS